MAKNTISRQTRMNNGYDPLKLAHIVEEKVCRTRNNIVERRYYRFRGGRWYGGSATADCVGCNLRCRFCWSWRYGSFTTTSGDFYSPFMVTSKLVQIASKRKYRYVRVSGGEPVLCIDHLLKILDIISDTSYVFILETNGILIGSESWLAKKLASYDNLVIRVSIKAASPEEFHKVTGADPRAYKYQLLALKNLVDAGMEPGERVYPAVMLSFSKPENIKELLERIHSIHPDLLASLDPEIIIMYPHVVELLRKYGLKPIRYISPEKIPDYMI